MLSQVLPYVMLTRTGSHMQCTHGALVTLQTSSVQHQSWIRDQRSADLIPTTTCCARVVHLTAILFLRLVTAGCVDVPCMHGACGCFGLSARQWAYLLHNSPSINCTRLVLVWVIVHTKLRHISALTHLFSLQMDVQRLQGVGCCEIFC